MTTTNTTNGETIGTALPREMARVRDEVMPTYHAIGHAGIIALTMMLQDLDRAAKALAEQDVAAMLCAFEALRGYRT